MCIVMVDMRLGGGDGSQMFQERSGAAPPGERGIRGWVVDYDE